MFSNRKKGPTLKEIVTSGSKASLSAYLRLGGSEMPEDAAFNAISEALHHFTEPRGLPRLWGREHSDARAEAVVAKLAECGFTIEKVDAVEGLRTALKFGIGSALNELVAIGMPLEWSSNSGLGKMLTALGCTSLSYDEGVRDLINFNT